MPIRCKFWVSSTNNNNDTFFHPWWSCAGIDILQHLYHPPQWWPVHGQSSCAEESYFQNHVHFPLKAWDPTLFAIIFFFLYYCIPHFTRSTFSPNSGSDSLLAVTSSKSIEVTVGSPRTCRHTLHNITWKFLKYSVKLFQNLKKSKINIRLASYSIYRIR